MTGQIVRQSRRVKRGPRKLTQDPRLGPALPAQTNSRKLFAQAVLRG